MPWRICTRFPEDKTRVICIRIPMPWEFPQPVRWLPPSSDQVQPGDPSPWKWAESKSISDEQLQRLPLLAAIDQLAVGLDGKARESIQKIVRKIASANSGLPASAEIHFE